jgi:SAM-dependent methyltransferase
MNCRHCGSELKLTLIDLGSAPPSNAYISAEMLHAPEKWYPLRALVCESCWLVQTEDFTQADDLFNADYGYFSSFSTSWLEHSECYVEDMVRRFGLNGQSHIVEVAANDGYLLQYVQAHNIACTGIEPTNKTATAARSKGIDIVEEFFSVQLAQTLKKQGKQADLTVANNVLAHVPDINDFVSGFALLLKPEGVATFEFPHLMQLIAENQFDTIYHEHFSYLTLTSVNQIFAENGLVVFDVEELVTHGGSLRVFAQRADSGQQPQSSSLKEMLDRERSIGMNTAAYYKGFQVRAETVKNDLLKFLLSAKDQGKTVAAYGAAAKGNTMLNFAGVRPDLVKFVVDRNPKKQGQFMPGSRIPIVDEAHLKAAKPDYVVILPWNLKNEIVSQLSYVKEFGARFVTAVPKLSQS